MSNIHILTSVKGGVGKTLVSLGAICGFENQGANSLIAIDLNTTNPDLFRILSFGQSSAPTGGSGWQVSELNNWVHIFAPDDPYILPSGAHGFWSSLHKVTTFPEYNEGNWDVVVDTNLHVANLVLPEDNITILEQALRKPGRRIYLWIFWTWTALQNMLDIDTALATLMGKFPDKICVAHVLNPSALIPPQINLTARLRLLEGLKWLEDMPESVREIKGAHYLDDLKKELLTRFAASPELQEYDIPGLAGLASANVVPPISYREFQETITLAFQNFDPNVIPEEAFIPLHDVLMKEYQGCPRNILPIATHNPGLIGYTDLFARKPPKSIGSIRDHIGLALEKNVFRFCRNLVCANLL